MQRQGLRGAKHPCGVSIQTVSCRESTGEQYPIPGGPFNADVRTFAVHLKVLPLPLFMGRFGHNIKEYPCQ